MTTNQGACGLALTVLSLACGSDPAGLPSDQQQGPAQAAAGATQVAAAGNTGASAGRGALATQAPSSAGRSAQVGAAGNGAAPAAVGGRDAALAGAGASPTNPAAAGSGGSIPVASTAGTGAAAGSGAAPSTTTPGIEEKIECTSKAPAEFEVNANIGGGGSQPTDSPHFRIYGASGQAAMDAINELEAAYNCYVETLCWRSSGLSFNQDNDDGPFYKMNIYAVGNLGGAAGQMFSDAPSGLSYLRVVSSYLPDAKVTVHEYGHALTYHEQGWVEQTRTGAWWETVANFVADTFMTSPICAASREKFKVPEGKTIIELRKVLGDSHQVIVDGSQGSGNYYQAWPFLAYLTNNPDGYKGLGKTALREMFRNHMGNNETPLHVLERVAMGTKVQTIVGRYWARMAFVDIGHKQAQEAFLRDRASLRTANLDAAGSDMYRVKQARAPRYFGANIIPLQGSGAISVKVASSGGFTATLAIRGGSGAVRYVDLPEGAGEAMLAAGEEASLVVVNTPAMLIQYDPFSISGEVARGLDYTVQLTGATPAS